jgi:hypothetical protein
MAGTPWAEAPLTPNVNFAKQTTAGRMALLQYGSCQPTLPKRIEGATADIPRPPNAHMEDADAGKSNSFLPLTLRAWNDLPNMD